MKYCVYKITNLVNGKIYIGVTSNFIKRWSQHKYSTDSLIGLAIKKYGENNFTHEFVDYSNDPNEVLVKETKYIQQYDSLSPNGYNLLLRHNSCATHNKLTKQFLSKLGQKTNRAKQKSNYIGVSVNIQNHKKYYTARVVVLGKIYNKNFPTDIECAQAYDKIVVYIYGPDARLNFPEQLDFYLDTNLEEFYNFFTHKNKHSEYLGVFKFPELDKWLFRINSKKLEKDFSHGPFDSQREAAIARDKVIIYYDLNLKLNFPQDVENYKSMNLAEFVTCIRESQIKTSHYEGVCLKSGYKNKKKPHKNNIWCAYWTKNKKRFHIGYFDSPEEASKARKKFIEEHEKQNKNLI